MILLLDDDQSRIEGFNKVITQLSDIKIHSWSNAPTMISEISEYLSQAKLISLDHDLYKLNESDPEPGTGRDVAEFLTKCKPVCPIIIHSTNVDAAWGMYNTLSYVGWSVNILHYIDEDWFSSKWLPEIKKIINS